MPTHKHDTADQSNDIAYRIRKYWAARGFTVKTETGTASQFGGSSNVAAWGVRSNMIGGLPNPNPNAPVFKGRPSILLKTANGIDRVFLGQFVPEEQS